MICDTSWKGWFIFLSQQAESFLERSTEKTVNILKFMWCSHFPTWDMCAIYLQISPAHFHLQFSPCWRKPGFSRPLSYTRQYWNSVFFSTEKWRSYPGWIYCKCCVENHGRKLLPFTRVTYETVTTCEEILSVLLPLKMPFLHIAGMISIPLVVCEPESGNICLKATSYHHTCFFWNIILTYSIIKAM